MKKRIFSRVLALFMALTLLSTTAFAASFADLQDAITGTIATEGAENTVNGTLIDGSSGRYGYAWDAAANNNAGWWGIEAWTTQNENGDSIRNVSLNEDVVYNEDGNGKDNKTISVTGASVILDMNGKTIDGGARFETSLDKDANKITTTVTETGSGKAVITTKNSSLTITGDGGTITGGTGAAVPGDCQRTVFCCNHGLTAACLCNRSCNLVRVFVQRGFKSGASINTTRIYLMTSGAEHARQLEKLGLVT